MGASNIGVGATFQVVDWGGRAEIFIMHILAEGLQTTVAYSSRGPLSNFV